MCSRGAAAVAPVATNAPRRSAPVASLALAARRARPRAARRDEQILQLRRERVQPLCATLQTARQPSDTFRARSTPTAPPRTDHVVTQAALLSELPHCEGTFSQRPS
jgi:hypothetical protein